MIPFRFLFVAIGIALLCAGLFFDMNGAFAQAATPTPDRLAQPTLPAKPTQADKGAQVYWLACLPCHGDRGQGLTEDFIQTYPEEDHNCWASGCHGKNPYESGFTIPRYIPPVIGAGTLQNFPNAASLQSYIRAAMPYWKPGSMTEEESWQVTAFLLRENNLWGAQDELTASTAERILVGPPRATPAPQPSPPTDAPAMVSPYFLLAGFGILILLFILAGRLEKK
ncbi:MAG: c-type cytochrome [Chloroflexi bacterium]|nr:c-type cytochrome [Chloroflexota bacterium]